MSNRVRRLQAYATGETDTFFGGLLERSDRLSELGVPSALLLQRLVRCLHFGSKLCLSCSSMKGKRIST